MQTKQMRTDPVYGTRSPYPNYATLFRIAHKGATWNFDPWTGERRSQEDINKDPEGLEIDID